MTVAVYTPDGLPARLEVAGARRAPTLAGLRLSTLDNGKVPGAMLLVEARRRLISQGALEGATVVKRSPGQGLDASRMNELAHASDAVINALAD